MHAALLGLAAFLNGPPITGPKLVLPLPPFVAGPDARVEVGLHDGGLAVRLIVPALRHRTVDPDDDLGPHDAWAKF